MVYQFCYGKSKNPSYILFHFFQFASMLVKNVLSHELWSPELFPAQRAQKFLFGNLLSVVSNKLLNLTRGVTKSSTLIKML